MESSQVILQAFVEQNRESFQNLETYFSIFRQTFEHHIVEFCQQHDGDNYTRHGYIHSYDHMNYRSKFTICTLHTPTNRIIEYTLNMINDGFATFSTDNIPPSAISASFLLGSHYLHPMSGMIRLSNDASLCISRRDGDFVMFAKRVLGLPDNTPVGHDSNEALENDPLQRRLYRNHRYLPESNKLELKFADGVSLNEATKMLTILLEPGYAEDDDYWLTVDGSDNDTDGEDDGDL